MILEAQSLHIYFLMLIICLILVQYLNAILDSQSTLIKAKYY